MPIDFLTVYCRYTAKIHCSPRDVEAYRDYRLGVMHQNSSKLSCQQLCLLKDI